MSLLERLKKQAESLPDFGEKISYAQVKKLGQVDLLRHSHKVISYEGFEAPALSAFAQSFSTDWLPYLEQDWPTNTTDRLERAREVVERLTDDYKQLTGQNLTCDRVQLKERTTPLMALTEGSFRAKSLFEKFNTSGTHNFLIQESALTSPRSFLNAVFQGLALNAANQTLDAEVKESTDIGQRAEIYSQVHPLSWPRKKTGFTLLCHHPVLRLATKFLEDISNEVSDIIRTPKFDTEENFYRYQEAVTTQCLKGDVITPQPRHEIAFEFAEHTMDDTKSLERRTIALLTASLLEGPRDDHGYLQDDYHHMGMWLCANTELDAAYLSDLYADFNRIFDHLEQDPAYRQNCASYSTQDDNSRNKFIKGLGAFIAREIGIQNIDVDIYNDPKDRAAGSHYFDDQDQKHKVLINLAHHNDGDNLDTLIEVLTHEISHAAIVEFSSRLIDSARQIENGELQDYIRQGEIDFKSVSTLEFYNYGNFKEDPEIDYHLYRQNAHEKAATDIGFYYKARFKEFMPKVNKTRQPFLRAVATSGSKLLGKTSFTEFFADHGKLEKTRSTFSVILGGKAPHARRPETPQ